MSEQELRQWANSRKGSGDAVAEAVGRLFERLDSTLIVAEGGDLQVLDRAPDVPLDDEITGGGVTWTQAKPNTALHRGVDPFDGSTGTPADGKAGRIMSMPPGASQ